MANRTAIEPRADNLKNEPVYYSFTMSLAQCFDGVGPRILVECVRGASPGFWRVFTGILANNFREKPLNP
jgi:hypothetical protein